MIGHCLKIRVVKMVNITKILSGDEHRDEDEITNIVVVGAHFTILKMIFLIFITNKFHIRVQNLPM